jgi:PelA/Pel-15E family pectate lyase
MLTPERVAALPQREQLAWQSYLETSMTHAAHERDTLATECRRIETPTPRPASTSRKEFEFASDAPPAWYGSAEALQLAATVLSYQTPTGGWSKGIDYRNGPRAAGMSWTNNAGNPWHYCGTLDNRSTTSQMEFLAGLHAATGHQGARDGIARGLEWLLAAQYPNGGWPQNYPIEPGYHEAITLNDGAMLHALELLLSASEGREPFTFVNAGLRQRAAEAVTKGFACLLAAQVQVDGKPAVWCAQHDPLSLVPVAARLKEPPSLSGAESAELLRFLMRRGPISPELVQSIEGGLQWLANHRIVGLRKTKSADGKTDYTADPDSTEIYWARFYDLSTGAPIFAGAQDGIIYSSFHEMAQNNVVAYDYFTTKPAELLAIERERWMRHVQAASK